MPEFSALDWHREYISHSQGYVELYLKLKKEYKVLLGMSPPKHKNSEGVAERKNKSPLMEK